MKDRETAQEKLEYEIFSEQCFEQEKEKKKIQCDGIDCAWCGIIECPREKSNG